MAALGQHLARLAAVVVAYSIREAACTASACAESRGFGQPTSSGTAALDFQGTAGDFCGSLGLLQHTASARRTPASTPQLPERAGRHGGSSAPKVAVLPRLAEPIHKSPPPLATAGPASTLAASGLTFTKAAPTVPRPGNASGPDVAEPAQLTPAAPKRNGTAIWQLAQRPATTPASLLAHASPAAAHAMLLVGAMGAIEASTAAAPDRDDWSAIGIVAVIIFCLYFVLFTVRAATKDEDEEKTETLAERWAHVQKGRWAIPRLGVRSEALPAVCTKVLTQNRDVPLLMPLEYLKQTPRVGWSAEILGGTNGSRLFKVCLMPAVRGKPRCLEVLGHSPHGEEDTLLVSVTAGLEIFNGEGKSFGKLARRADGEYMLEETLGRDPRWAISLDLAEDPSGSSMTMTLLPKGKLLATVSKGQRYLTITNTHGVDAVLVLACALGLVAFEFAPAASLSSRLRDVRDRVEGTAASLLTRFENAEGTAASLLTRLHT